MAHIHMTHIHMTHIHIIHIRMQIIFYTQLEHKLALCFTHMFKVCVAPVYEYMAHRDVNLLGKKFCYLFQVAKV